MGTHWGGPALTAKGGLDLDWTGLLWTFESGYEFGESLKAVVLKGMFVRCDAMPRYFLARMYSDDNGLSWCEKHSLPAPT